MRIAAITTRDRASLFLDSVVGSSVCKGIVSTCDNVERFVWPSDTPFLLRGRMSEEMLGELENVRDDGRASACAEGGLESGYGSAFVSIESDFRWPNDCWLSWALAAAAAAAIPSPPLLLAFFRFNSASSKISRFRFGETGVDSGVYVGGRNCGSMFVGGSAALKAGDAGAIEAMDGLYSR